MDEQTKTSAYESFCFSEKRESVSLRVKYKHIYKMPANKKAKQSVCNFDKMIRKGLSK